MEEEGMRVGGSACLWRLGSGCGLFGASRGVTALHVNKARLEAARLSHVYSLALYHRSATTTLSLTHHMRWQWPFSSLQSQPLDISLTDPSDPSARSITRTDLQPYTLIQPERGNRVVGQQSSPLPPATDQRSRDTLQLLGGLSIGGIEQVETRYDLRGRRRSLDTVSL
jgi:hypothetical protein